VTALVGCAPAKSHRAKRKRPAAQQQQRKGFSPTNSRAACGIPHPLAPREAQKPLRAAAKKKNLLSNEFARCVQDLMPRSPRCAAAKTRCAAGKNLPIQRIRVPRAGPSTALTENAFRPQ
jgi:hypothetical protein